MVVWCKQKFKLESYKVDNVKFAGIAVLLSTVLFPVIVIYLDRRITKETAFYFEIITVVYASLVFLMWLLSQINIDLS